MHKFDATLGSTRALWYYNSLETTYHCKQPGQNMLGHIFSPANPAASPPVTKKACYPDAALPCLGVKECKTQSGTKECYCITEDIPDFLVKSSHRACMYFATNLGLSAELQPTGRVEHAEAVCTQPARKAHIGV